MALGDYSGNESLSNELTSEATVQIPLDALKENERYVLELKDRKEIRGKFVTMFPPGRGMRCGMMMRFDGEDGSPYYLSVGSLDEIWEDGTKYPTS